MQSHVEEKHFYLTQQELRRSRNLYIREIVANNFYLLPAAQNSLSHDLERKTISYLDVERISVNAIYERLKTIKPAYRQACLSVVVDCLEIAFSELNAAYYDQKSGNQLSYNVFAPNEYHGKISVVSGDIQATGKLYKVGVAKEGRSETLFEVNGETKVELQLDAISSSEYRSLLKAKMKANEKKFAKFHKKYNRHHTDYNTLKAQIKNEANYPTFLYRIIKIETNSQFLHDTVMKKNIPNWASKKYSDEIINSTTAPAKVATLAALSHKYLAYYANKITHIVKKELFAEYQNFSNTTEFRDNELVIKDGFDFNKFINEATTQSTLQKVAAKNEVLKGSIEKYQAMLSLSKGLAENIDPNLILINYKQGYKKLKPMLNRSHDNFAKYIVKCITTVLTLGMSKALGMWKTTGSDYTQDVDKLLYPKMDPRKKKF